MAKGYISQPVNYFYKVFISVKDDFFDKASENDIFQRFVNIIVYEDISAYGKALHGAFHRDIYFVHE